MSPKLERRPQARRTALALADGTSEALTADVRAAFAHSDGLVTQHLARPTGSGFTTGLW